MRCPSCQNEDTKVLDSRPVEEGSAIRRRRECEKCQFRFSTYEEIEILDLTILKKDGRKELFSKEKLERSIKLPLDKRPHKEEVLKKLVSAIEIEIQKKAKEGDISSVEIGEIVMKKLKKTDKVAYIRFAAVYRQFEDVEEFKEEISKL
jgi:transcriptional repressor NrdR